MDRQQADARQAILATIERYFAAIDGADKDLLARCFAEDARFVSAGGSLDMSGRDAIAARLASGRFPATTHLRGSSVITLDRDGAAADTRALAFLAETAPAGSWCVGCAISTAWSSGTETG